MTSVPLICPDGVQKRGICLLGNFYSIENTGAVSLISTTLEKDIESYLTHVVAPTSDGMMSNATMILLNTY